MKRLSKKILIINAWGGNKGDEAQINALYRIIKQIDPSVEVSFLPFRNENIELDSGITRGNMVIRRVGKYYYSLLSRILHKVRDKGKLRKIKLLLRKTLEFIVKSFSFLDLNFLSGYRMIISAPQGPTISDISYKEKKILTLYPLYYAWKHKIPYCIIGVSMGPFDDNSYKDKWVGDVLAHAKRIIVREDISYANVKKKYPQLKNVVSAIDIVFSDNNGTQDLENPKDYQDYKKRFKSGWVGGCISLTPARTPLNDFNIDKYIEKISGFFDFIIENTGKNLLLFPHLKKDFPYLNKIKNSSRFTGSIEVLPRQYNSDYQQNIMENMEFFISSRYHPTVFAIKARVPFFCIINQFKTLGMLRKLDLVKDETWQDDSIEKWHKNFINSWNDRDYILNTIEKNSSNIKKLSEIYYEELSALLP